MLAETKKSARSAAAAVRSEDAPLDRGLSARGVSKSYFGTVVLERFNIDIKPGEVVALLGENGAGKSTFSGIIAGGVTPDAGGSMYWNGQPYRPANPREAMDAGISMIHQEMRLLPDLSIAENIFVGNLPMKGGRVDRAVMNRLATEKLRLLGLEVDVNREVRTLRVAAQQQVEIAKALVKNARLLILDEPTAALGGEETEKLFACIRDLRAEGVSFLYISHRLEEISHIANRIVVLRDGKVVNTHDRADIEQKALIAEMVGRTVDRLFPVVKPPGEQVVLEVENLTGMEDAFRNVSFNVRAGEVFGIAGLVGAGRTELVRAVAGADPIVSGLIRIDGREVRLRGPRDSISARVVLIPEDRKAQGLILTHSLADNIAYTNLDLIKERGWIKPSRVMKMARESIRRLGVKGAPEQSGNSLSGGNQQKLVISKWLNRNPKIAILDEPTRGIDVGARASIYETIAELAQQGMAVVIVSSDLEEVLGFSHRVLVLNAGRCMGILDRSEATSVRVMELATKD